MSRLRVAVAVLLVWGAYWAALPWIDCVRAVSVFGIQGPFIAACTFGHPGAEPGPGAAWPNVVVGAVYLVSAAILFTRRRPI